jgi:hypothetical protein
MNIPNYLKSLALISILCGSYASAHEKNKCDCSLVPNSLKGYTINYQVLNSKTQETDAPYKGVLVSQYTAKHFKTQGTGTLSNNADPRREYAEGKYKFKQKGCNQAIETATTSLPGYSTRTTHLSFTSKSSGTWEQNIDHGRIILSGKFSLVKTDAAATAPTSKAGYHYSLIIKSTKSDLPPESYPRAGLVLQTYEGDGSMTFLGTGPGTINSTGTYSYKKVSPNTGVEETIQNSEFFSLPYTMVLTYETEDSGTWEQNFADGLIKFSGTFDRFPSK